MQLNMDNDVSQIVFFDEIFDKVFTNCWIILLALFHLSFQQLNSAYRFRLAT